jgi:hypothetical protein
MSRIRLLISLLALAGLLAGSLPGLLSAGEVAPAQSLLTADIVVHLYYGTRANLDFIAAHYDVWQVQKDQGYAVVMLSPDQYSVLLDQGYVMVVDQKLTGMVQHPESIPGYPCYRTARRPMPRCKP